MFHIVCCFESTCCLLIVCCLLFIVYCLFWLDMLIVNIQTSPLYPISLGFLSTHKSWFFGLAKLWSSNEYRSCLIASRLPPKSTFQLVLNCLVKTQEISRKHFSKHLGMLLRRDVYLTELVALFDYLSVCSCFDPFCFWWLWWGFGVLALLSSFSSINLDPNKKNNYKLSELKSVYIDAEGAFLRFVFQDCYVNEFNTYNQVTTDHARSNCVFFLYGSILLLC